MNPDFENMIETLVRELLPVARDDASAWEPLAMQTSIPAALDRSGGAESFLAWAGDHRRWRFAVAEALEESCAKPRETALSTMRLILEERFEEIADQE